LKTIGLEPLTRVEGHGRVELDLDRGRLTAVRVALIESPRLFESLVIGRSWQEIPALVCRICAICSSVHRVASAAALEQALGVSVPPAARLVRELLVLGGHIESHALHLFCLVLPDILGVESVMALVAGGSAQAREGLELKRLGNRIQEISGGRVIHPINIEVGGILRLPERSRLQGLAEELEEWEGRLVDLLAVFASPQSYPPSSGAIGVPLSVSGGEGFHLFGQGLSLAGRMIAPAEYRELLGEEALPGSHARSSRGAAGPFLTGALARLRNSGGEEGGLPFGIFANNAAQAMELLEALRRARGLTREILALGDDEALRGEVRVGAGVGTEVIEAPRGLLVHHYVLDDGGRVARADIVTPTAINQETMAAQILADLQEVTDEALLSSGAEQIVRAFDPCISCAVHLVRIR
jgi:coenzyme F420-reducing hydrogenase alpha subunit